MCWTLRALVQRLIDSDEIRFPGVEKRKTPQGSNANMRIFKDPLPDHASGSKGIPINALEVDEPPSHPRYHSGKVEIMRRVDVIELLAGEEGDRTSSKLSKEVAPPPKKDKSRRSTRWFLRRFEKSTTSRLLLESPEASHQPKKLNYIDPHG